MSKRVGDDAEEENERPHKRPRLSQDDHSAACRDAFPECYSACRNEDMLVLHHGTQLPAKIDGGHIRGTVVQTLKHSNRKCAGLVLNLGSPDSSSASGGHLECELRNARALECQLPAFGDVVFIALTNAKLEYNVGHDQLSFKLKFQTSLIYIIPHKDGDARILKLVETIGDNSSREVPVVTPGPAMPRPPRLETGTHEHRVRKRETRLPSNKEVPTENPTQHKPPRRNAKAIKAALIRISTNVSPSAQASPLPITSQVLTEEPVHVTDQEMAHEEPEGELPSNQIEEHPFEVLANEVMIEQVQNEVPRSGFATSKGVEFIPLDNVNRLPKGAWINIAGVVEQVWESKRAIGGDFCQVFYLSDPSKSSFKTTLFQKKQEWLPNVQPGQILLLSSVNCDNFQGTYTATGRSTTFKWIAYDPPTKSVFYASVEGGPKYTHLDREAMEYFAKLADWKAKIENDPNRIIIGIPERKHKLLSELSQDHKYFNATVEILDVQHNDDWIGISVTDYTKNELFVDRYLTPPPLVQYKRTLVLEVWKAESKSYELASSLRKGKYYRIKNFIFLDSKFAWVGKVSRKDDVEFQQLREDCEDPDLRRLIERKRAYVPDEFDEIDVQDSGMPIFLGNPSDEPDLQVKGKPVPVLEPLSGHRVFCEATIPYTSFSSIDNDPRNCVEYKIRGRIIGITPTNPQEMVQICCTQCQRLLETTPDDSVKCSECHSANTLGFDVGLFLRVVDEENQQCTVIIRGDDAKHLFGIPEMVSDNANLARESVVKDVVSKLRNVVGKLWVEGPLFESPLEDGAPLDVPDENEEIKIPKSPWVDLVVQSWISKTPEVSNAHGSEWSRKYSLHKCIFQLVNPR